MADLTAFLAAVDAAAANEADADHWHRMMGIFACQVADCVLTDEATLVLALADEYAAAKAHIERLAVQREKLQRDMETALSAVDVGGAA